MKIVIDIPESVYCKIKPTVLKPMLYTKNTVEMLFLEMANAIRNGTPLPKGHGGLITKEQAIKELKECNRSNGSRGG